MQRLYSKLKTKIENTRKNIQLTVKMQIEQEIRGQKENDKKSLQLIKRLKKCPICNTQIIKNGGYNHM